MAVPRKLTIIFMFFYAAVLFYIIMFFLSPDFQTSVILFRYNLANVTEGSNYMWALVICFVICFLGSASIGFPIPFPFVLFSLSNSVYLKYLKRGLSLDQILQTAPFWFEIMGLAIVGGLGCALGEFSGYAVGYGAKALADDTNSELLKNFDGFGKVVFENERRIPFYVFLFALTPLPDDILFLPLGMMKYPWWKCIIPGWLGKTFTTIFYCIWPIMIAYGINMSGMETNDISSIITEAILLLVTISIMFFIMSFNWEKYLQNKKKQKKLATN